jgi:hypothetical protein
MEAFKSYGPIDRNISNNGFTLTPPTHKFQSRFIKKASGLTYSTFQKRA